MSASNITRFATRVIAVTVARTTLREELKAITADIKGMSRASIIELDACVVREVAQKYGGTVKTSDANAAKMSKLVVCHDDKDTQAAANMLVSRARGLYDPARAKKQAEAAKARAVQQAAWDKLTPAQQAIQPFMDAVNDADADTLPALRTALQTALVALDKAAKALKA